ncbi:DUF6677 family protein [Paenibacillus radicis (ex Gao et al. 2016)]|uniref:Adhesin domain-containing protein n=1 Tax=Paenibacillus radicis (ex Gao et al. 2016) TaxID=1737354 RepID=A0A917HK64_9BACL|nr:DUF6677 family protein [Paenibacillus radicis (ex Gao et al. 2016)]GGG81224.1 hypothetical protein GCM10010918_43050 [Paenibacillus radicis (ex Gao et al. 2016)]
MRELGVKRPKSRLLAAVLAFILPGSGHLYAGRYARGLLIMAGLMLDVAAIIRLADANGARHLLFIVYLALAVPAFYFVSVYDALQSVERPTEKPSRLTMVSGFLLMIGGLLLAILIRPPASLVPWMNELADYSVGPLLAVTALILIIIYWKGAVDVFKLGRFTSAAIIVAIGCLLLSDQLQNRNDIALLLHWWPAVFVLLGAEIILFSIFNRKKERRLRLDFGGGLLAIIIAATALVVTQYAELPFKWLDQYVELKGSADYGEEKGFRYTKEQIVIPLEESVSEMTISNPNGHVTLRSGDVNSVLVDTEVWVDTEDQTEAGRIAEKSRVDTSSDSAKLTIQGIGEPYGASGGRKPRINLIVTMPREATELSLSVHVTNGEVDVNGVAAAGGLRVNNVSGDIQLSDIQGNVEASGISGSVKLSGITGSANATTKNGAVDVASVSGELVATTINGSVKVKDAGGAVEAETKNGKISIEEAASSVKADTLNGGIELSSSVIGGDWDVDSSVGEIKVEAPENGDFTVYGSVTFGSIDTDFPFTVSKKTVRGTVGAGTYRIQINATNSISIHAIGLLASSAFIDKSF